MDGVGQYVTVRRDFFATTGLVASTAPLPLTLASTSIVNQNPQATTKANEHDCQLCSKSFSSRALLARHLKSHTLLASTPPSSSPPSSSSHGGSQDQTIILRCEQGGCNGRVFASQISLVKHIKNSHDSPVGAADSPTPPHSSSEATKPQRSTSEKRFQCGQCSKRFPTSKDLKRHDVVHTGNREFQCSFCSHRFGRKDHRMRHEKKTHANELLSSSSPISPSLVTSLSSASKESSEKRTRWRHVSSPAVSTTSASSPPPIKTDVEMTDLPPVRIRAMSTSEAVAASPQRPPSRRTDAPLYDETSLKYLESQLSPESLLMEDTTASEDDAAPWFMSDFIIKSEMESSERSPASPPVTPDPSSLSPPVLYPTTVPPPSTELVGAPVNAPEMEVTKLSRCDVLTRTKNPVLPSVYIDNSLIVPEPSKQKYQSISSSSGLLTGSDIDLDYYEAFMDEKDTLFPV